MGSPLPPNNPRAPSSQLLCTPPAPPEDYAVSVTPDGGSQTWPTGSTGHKAVFTITNTGICQDTYNFYYSVTGSITNPRLSGTSAYLNRGASTTDTVTYDAGNPGTGTITLYTYGTDGPATDNGSYNVTITPPPYQVAVTPDGSTTPTRTSGTAYADSFTVQNSGGNADTYSLTCSGSNVTCSTVSPAGPITLGPNVQQVITVNYTAGSPGTGSLNLQAASGQANDAGSYVVPIVSYGVAVTPDGATTPQRIAGSSGYSENFTVQNTGTAQNTYNLSCPNSANVTCTGLTIHGNSVSSVTLASGISDTVVASYNVGAEGTWTLSLTATGTNASDPGSYQVPVITGNAVAPVVDLTPASPGTFRDRDLCLTIAVGAAAASECGDLRIVHGLPTTRTMNKARTPTLLYNSQTAHPYPIVPFNVTLPPTAAVPESVTAVLRIGGATWASGKWPKSQWTSGQTRRIAVAFDAVTLATGVYAYTLEVTNWYLAPTAPQVTTVNNEMIIVNRSASPFGAGWWLAGLEQLFGLADGRRLVVLGDGGARVYSPVGGNLHTTPNPTRLDTLDGSGTDYVRRAPHGARVYLSATSYKHITTVNRLGHQTMFAYDGCGRLLTITVPPGGTVYTFNYASPSDCTTRLVSVTAPGNRTTTLTDPAGNVTAIADPDGSSVGFGYDLGFASRIISRTDRRGNTTSYAFDTGGKLTADSLPLGTGQTPIVQRLRPAESIGLTAAVDTALVYTSLNGPRTDITNDTTAFWLDQFGAPRRIVNALGYQTLLKREDSRWPALVTELQAPNQFVTRASYDARGNIVTDTALNPLGDGRSAITRYEWDSKWDFVTKIVRPELDSVMLSYDATNGNRLWQQDGRGASSETDFYYYSGPDSVNGLLRSIRTPSQSLSSSRDSVTYNALGNLAATKTPAGHWTFYRKDTIGRDTLIVSPTLNDSVQYQRFESISYDLADRVTQTRSIGPRLHYYDPIGAADSMTKAESLWVVTYYNAEDLPDSVQRSVRPNWNSVNTLTTKWTYDAAGRRLKEIAPDAAADSTVYDPAGNAIQLITRRGHTITLSYDPLNRLTQRITPSVPYGPWNPHAQNEIWYFPGYRADASGGLTVPNDGTYGLTIAGETETFTYDAVGNILTADNAAAKIRRRYNPNGTLSADTLKTLPYVGTDTTIHVYGLLFTYDLDGRRTSLKHPYPIAPRQQGSVKDTEGYQYYSTTGLLHSVTDVLGEGFEYTYDVENRVAQLDRGEPVLGGSPQIRLTYTYDADGRDSLRMESWVGGASQVTHADTLFYDAHNKVVRTRTSADTTNLTYTGLGALAWSSSFQRQSEYPSSRPSERYLPDALGNLYEATHVENTGSSVDVNGTVFQTNTGRLLQSWHAAARGNPHSAESNKTYDAAGNIYQADGWSNNTYNGEQLVERTASYYDAAGRLRVQDHRSCLIVIQTLICDNVYAPEYDDRAAFEEYRYDALGRRVLVRTRSESHCGLRCRNAITRGVWDGDQILYEISSPGATSATVAQLEQDTAQVNQQDVADYEPYGRVVYAHGTGLDAPLGLVRVNFSNVFPEPTLIVPLGNWQAQYDMGIIAGYKNPSTDGANFCRRYPNPMTSPLYCFQIDWPAPYMWKTLYSRSRGVQGPRSWNGSLIEAGRDNTGQMYRRNRYYDPASGRFTQEDPIGLAGGVNLYGFAAGDPVNFGDPFGLTFCVKGATQALIDRAKTALASAVDATIIWDKKNCVVGHIKPGSNRAFRALQMGFQAMVNSKVAFTGRLGGAAHSPQRSSTEVAVEEDIEAHGYFTGAFFGNCNGGSAPYAMGQVFAHELIHHFPVASGGAMDTNEQDAIEHGDNVFNPNRGMVPRCNHYRAY